MTAKPATTNYWTMQAERLPYYTSSQLKLRLEQCERQMRNYPVFAESADYRNYYEHVKREYAERIGRKTCL